MMASPRGIVVGNPVADEVLRDGHPVVRSPGGTATYATLALRAMGVEVTLLGSVGRDHGAWLIQTLAESGADLSAVRLVATPSTSYQLHYRGNARTVRLREPGPVLTPDRLPARPAQAAFVHLGAVAGEVPPATVEHLAGWDLPMGMDLHALRRFGPDGAVSLAAGVDTGLPFEALDTVKGSLEEIRAFDPACPTLEDAMRRIARHGVRHVLATDGSRGALLLSGHRLWAVPAFPVIERDSTGAGDVFLAAFLWARHGLGEAPLPAALFAAAAASFVVEGPGATVLGDPASIAARQAHLASLSPEAP